MRERDASLNRNEIDDHRPGRLLVAARIRTVERGKDKHGGARRYFVHLVD
ncbi:MAG: hypothetical protein ABSF69_22990 [Polyangiaceae bacterium]|jgi:hypothetical protein